MHCQRYPAGDHLVRYEEAERRGVLGCRVLAAVAARLGSVGPHVIVPDRRSCPREHAVDFMTAAEFEDWSASPAGDEPMTGAELAACRTAAAAAVLA